MSQNTGEPIGAADGDGFRQFGEHLGRMGESAGDRLLDWLVDDYFRLDLLGPENIPSEGPAVVVANRSGAWDLDALVLQKVFARGIGRTLAYARGPGAVPLGAAPGPELERLNARELLGVFPEGNSGPGTAFRKRYRLRPFDPGFAVSALRSGAPVVPVAVVGAEEAVPGFGEIPFLARLLGLPRFPVAPLFPFPAKWTVTIGEPIPVAAGPETPAQRADAAHGLCARARAALQDLLDRELGRRDDLFW
ncbi:1-acyl-sn-glycerol-3-phosphate acyltransferase [Streptomyces sp. SPB4]|uniref:lysophospholipid acyltransferase family protein n=1 Tax=Streptomyces sp. SPB4 TaxID=2940553 RepID=UPI002474A5FA|nr:1-acyl-sn-glycerol-3-phosphate acyltransferase [Streptomyces sp. SPB4]